jgi:hypothetical protein
MIPGTATGDFFLPASALQPFRYLKPARFSLPQKFRSAVHIP